MPTSQDDDVELSAIMNQAEPPKSPPHLDAAILQYAEEKADASASKRGSNVGFLSVHWLQRNWMSAAATFSVAAIAVSVSLQIFTEPDLGSSLNTAGGDLPFTESVSLTQASPALTVLEVAEQRSANSQVVQREVAPRSASIDDIANVATTQSQGFRDANLTQPATVGVDSITSVDRARQMSALEAQAVSADAAAASVEEVLVTGSPIRRSIQSAPVSVQPPQSDLAQSIIEDAALQETVIIALRRSLGVREQTTIAVQREFSYQINPLIETYRQLADPTILANIQNRYEVARSERLDARLPLSVEELVSILEALER